MMADVFPSARVGNIRHKGGRGGWGRGKRKSKRLVQGREDGVCDESGREKAGRRGRGKAHLYAGYCELLF